MSVVSMITGREVAGPLDAAAQHLADQATWARLNEERRRNRERKRAWRYLKRGGVAVREDLGGAVGVRWIKASRSGAFDTAICERWLDGGRLIAVEHGYAWAREPTL